MASAGGCTGNEEKKSLSEAASAAQLIDKAHVHGLIIAPLMWCEDQILSATLNNCSILPILLCNFIHSHCISELGVLCNWLKIDFVPLDIQI